jgi:microcin C transport system permease protein
VIEKLFKNELSLRRWRRFKRNRASMGAIAVIAAMTFFALTAEFWANSVPLVLKYEGQLYTPVLKSYHPSAFGKPGVMMDYKSLDFEGDNWAIWPPVRWGPLESNQTVARWPSPPTKENLFGTDDRGRDVFSRLLYGFRYSMAYAVSVWIMCSLLGMLAGAMMGYFGGLTDLLGQRVIEVMESMPGFLLLLIIISIFMPDLKLLISFTVFFSWIGVSYYFRAEFLKLRKREFVEAAHSLGVSQSRIIFSHVLPNSLTPWITMSPFMVSGYVASLAALDYLGFGLRPPTPSWGELLAQAQQHFTVAWWLAVFPSLALFLTLISLNLIGGGVREALDPRA